MTMPPQISSCYSTIKPRMDGGYWAPSATCEALDHSLKIGESTNGSDGGNLTHDVLVRYSNLLELAMVSNM